MTIWFDITNSPHVTLFAQLIRDLQSAHEVLVTCRELANTRDLLDQCGVAYAVVGRHYGSRRIMKALGFPARCVELWRFLKRRHIDVAVSHSSFYSPVVSRMLGVRSVYLNDNEHAGGNMISFPCATTIMVPEYLDIAKVLRQGAHPQKVIRYPGLKEGIYLWSICSQPCVPAPFSGNGKPILFYRPEPATAQYYSGDTSWVDDVLIALSRDFDCFISPRDRAQTQHYQQPRFRSMAVLQRPIPLAALRPACDVFVGAGGTMTREAAVLGIPTISIYQGDTLDVDRYLIRTGRMVHQHRITPAFVSDFFASCGTRAPAGDLLQKGRTAYELLKSVILNTHEPRN